MDVSDAGIVVGRYTFSDAQSHESEPGFYNISTKEWTKLELPTEIDGKIDYENAVYGEATAISADAMVNTLQATSSCAWTIALVVN